MINTFVRPTVYASNNNDLLLGMKLRVEHVSERDAYATAYIGSWRGLLFFAASLGVLEVGDEVKHAISATPLFQLDRYTHEPVELSLEHAIGFVEMVKMTGWSRGDREVFLVAPSAFN